MKEWKNRPWTKGTMLYYDLFVDGKMVAYVRETCFSKSATIGDKQTYSGLHSKKSLEEIKAEIEKELGV